MACWIAGGIEVVLFGCCAAGLLVIGFVSPAQLQQQGELPPGVTAGQVLLAMRWLAGILAVVMVLPGLVLLYLGFAVRQGGRGAMLAAGVILIVQAALIGVLTLLSVVGGLMTGDLLGTLVNLLLFGGVTALLIWAAVLILRARGGGGATGSMPHDEEPWNSHLGGGW
ncbi:MAG: hypothetical protein ACODAQ_01280 [Phycisphaeraceae bacterium]